MKKTSVYLTEDEVADLRRLAAREGRSQAELIRDGVRQVIERAGHQQRELKSMGRGHGAGKRYRRWSSREVYDKAFGAD